MQLREYGKPDSGNVRCSLPVRGTTRRFCLAFTRAAW
jgi:hypothetical protein